MVTDTPSNYDDNDSDNDDDAQRISSSSKTAMTTMRYNHKDHCRCQASDRVIDHFIHGKPMTWLQFLRTVRLKFIFCDDMGLVRYTNIMLSNFCTRLHNFANHSHSQL